MRWIGALSVAAACGGNIAATPDAAPQPTTDASADVDDDVPDAWVDPYHDITDTKFWSSVVLATLAGPEAFYEFRSACFDGRYIYWGASVQRVDQQIMLRYDTQGAFDDPSAWTKWLTGYIALASSPSLFDGRYVYIGMRGFTGDAYEARFDTTMTFGDSKSFSWSTLIAGGLVPDGAGLPVSDGHAMFLPNSRGSSTNPSRTIRWDMQTSFGTRAGWTTFDPHFAAEGPAIFADPYLVLTPSIGGDAVLYDTRLPFDAASSWSKIGVGGAAAQEFFAGPATDGRWIYYVPALRGPSIQQTVPSGLAARRDKLAPSSGLQTFDLTQVHPSASGFGQASWDGRYVYFMSGGFNDRRSIVIRHDTRLDFPSKASWTPFDMTPLAPVNSGLARGQGGVVFDGKYVYIPSYAGDFPNRVPYMMRFDARTNREMPPGFSGTFFSY